MRIRVAGVAALFLGIVACDGTAPAVPTSIRVSPATVTFQTLGETQQLTAEVLDAGGAPIAGTFVFSWTSSSPSSISVSSGGLATAVSAGTATVTASAEGVSGSGSATVDQAAAEVRIAQGDGQTGEAGAPLGNDLAVLVLDAGGNPAAQQSVTFSVIEGGGSVSPTTAITTATGMATTRWTLGAPGTPQLVRASIAGLQQDFTATSELGLLKVTTTTLNNARLTLNYQEGLVGSGGDGTYSWSIASGQLPAGLSLASNGQITGSPSGGVASSNFTAQVTDGGGATATKSLTLKVCEGPLQVGMGQVIESQAGSANACGMFLAAGSPGDAYRVALVRLSESESGGTIGVTVNLTASGAVAAPAASPLTAAFQQEVPRNRINFTPEMMEAMRTAERTEALHLEIREAESRLIAGLDRSAFLRPSENSGTGLLRGAMQQRVDPPSTVTLNVPGNFGSCTGGIPNDATLRGFNDHIALYEADNVTPAVGQAQMDQMLDYYRDYGHQVIESYFGGVTDINSDERMTVLITTNVQSGTAAFVWSGDFFDQSQCADSNAQETVYINPTIITAMADGNFQALNTMVHEAKHVTSLYNRIQANTSPPFHPGFIEEGTAEIAGEVAGRLSWAADGGPALGAKVRSSDFNGVNENNYGIFLRLARMVFYLSSQPNGVTASLTSRQGGIYGSGIMFHRWLGDAYGGATTPMADATLFQSQNSAATASGTAAFPGLVGMSYSDLLREYAKAVMLHGTGFEAAKTFTTYDLSTATEIFSLPDPAGSFPWPVTLTCDGGPCPDDIDSRDPESLPDNDDRNVQAWAPFATASYNSPMGPGGIRIFEFQSAGVGDGMEIVVSGTTQTRVYLSKIR